MTETATARRVTKTRGKRFKRPPTPFAASLPITVFALAVTLLGFAATIIVNPDATGAAHVFHGLALTGWVMLGLAQSFLAHTRRYRWHRKLGWWSLILFGLMFVLSWMMLLKMLSGKSSIPFAMAKFVGYTDLLCLPLILFLFCSAIYWRKDPHIHSRLMAASVLATVVPALWRLFNLVFWRTDAGIAPSLGLSFLAILGILAAAIRIDWKAGRLRWPLPFVLGWFAFIWATLWPVAQSQWFDNAARIIASMHWQWVSVVIVIDQ